MVQTGLVSRALLTEETETKELVGNVVYALYDEFLTPFRMHDSVCSGIVQIEGKNENQETRQ